MTAFEDSAAAVDTSLPPAGDDTTGAPTTAQTPGEALGRVEFRVLAGGQRGCRLPLPPGRYRAGTTAACDLLLDECPDGEDAFTLVVDDHTITLQPLQAGLRASGRVNPCGPLAPGEVLTLAGGRYAVDRLDAPWPEADEAQAATAIASASDGSATDGDDGSEHDHDADVPFDTVAGRMGPGPSSTTLPGEWPGARSGALGLLAVLGARMRGRKAAAPRRPLPPWWVLWLGGTAVFALVGVTVISAALTPANAVPAPSTARPAGTGGGVAAALHLGSNLGAGDGVPPALAAAVVAAQRADALVTLTQDTQGRWQLDGTVPTTEQRRALTQAARDAEPDLLINLKADDERASLAQDTLNRQLLASSWRIERLRGSELVLRGTPLPPDRERRLRELLLNDVPGLRVVTLLAAPDASASSALTAQPAGQLAGQATPGTGAAATSTSTSTSTGHRARIAGARTVGAEDIVLSVGGAAPYVMHADGRKEGRGAAAQP